MGQEVFNSMEQSSSEQYSPTDPAQAIGNLSITTERQPSHLEDVDLRKLCILGLPWDATEEMLQAYFTQYGPLEEATIIRKAKTGESRGFGFVTFRSAADAQVVRSREHTVGGRHCDAKQALPRGTSNPSRTTRLFIGRIPAGVTDIELRDYFSQFGRVQDAYIPKDAATDKQAHRGFGFVTFASADDVDKVTSCAHSIRNQELSIQCAIPKEKGPEFGQKGRWWQTLSNESYPSSADSAMSSMAANPSFVHLSAAGAQQSANAAVLAGRMPTELARSSTDFSRQIQRDEAPQNGAANSRVPGMRAGSSSGSLEPGHFDRLTFGGSTASNTGSRRSSVDINVQRLGSNDSGHLAGDQTVQALQGLTFGGGPEGIGIGLALLNARSQPTAPGQGHGPGLQPEAAFSRAGGFPNLPGYLHMGHSSLAAPSAGARQLQYNGSGASRGFARHPGPSSGPADAHAGPRIFLGKLNKDTNEQDVKEYFSKFGFVLDVYIPRDKVKRSEHRGFGFVTFETDAAIQRIVQHSPHQIKGSVIAIDAAVPRKEEPAVSFQDYEDGAPSAAATAAAQTLNLHSFSRAPGMSPSATAAAGFGNNLVVGSPASSYGINGLASPGSTSHHGGSPRVHPGIPLGSIPGSEVLSSGGQISTDQVPVSFDVASRSSLEAAYGPARNVPLDRVRNGFKHY